MEFEVIRSNRKSMAVEIKLNKLIIRAPILTPSNAENAPDDPMTKEEFLDELRELHIGEWRKSYSPRRFGYVVMDGTQWDLEIQFNNGRKSLRIYGDNAYPYNFDRFRETMGMDPFDIEDDEEDGK